jgi:hypothetical protein
MPRYPIHLSALGYGVSQLPDCSRRKSGAHSNTKGTGCMSEPSSVVLLFCGLAALFLYHFVRDHHVRH